ncbi:MAG: DUF1566 domain-containing protein [Gammaproteobacteria bacterium]|nr:DUF1566 domain-containing protein [Gammaproteobacteria bacterium]
MNPLAVMIVLGLTLAANSVEAQTCRSDIQPSTPTSRFEDHGNGTVTDGGTGLMWKRCVEGLDGPDCASGSANTLTWHAALDHARTHEFAGYDDWRLPNLKELWSLVEVACYGPAINTTVFPNTPSAFVWSASPYTNSPGSAWFLGTGSGDTGAGDKDTGDTFGWYVADSRLCLPPCRV